MAKKSISRGIFALISGLIWLAVLLVILSNAGDFLLSRSMKGKSSQATVAEALKPPESKPIPQEPPIPWEQIDEDVRMALLQARAAADTFAAAQLDAWTQRLMRRVDHDFLKWYFDYWNQQMLGLKGLYQTMLHTWDESNPTAAETVTEEIQREFAQRVLQPQLAQLEIERITRETVNVYVDQLRGSLDTIPERYRVPQEQWSRYMAGIAVMTATTEGNRDVPLTLKTLTAASAGGAILLAKPIKAAAGKVGAKVSSKMAAKSSAKLAAKTGEKVAGKMGGKMLGPIIGIGIIVWDLYDHETTRAQAEPMLRDSIEDYLYEVKDAMLHDTEDGVMAVVHEIEFNALQSLDAREQN